ncbi:uncharacterized protein LOC116296189 [Actinia tenebrosa]|uniref:Uncharacterized protein LOC116296189 n=1 Tax=Actinia tenebrosa TaxID=6105 RepID=A0A6P8HXG8_ACTTE|nr:uncharacterized protein LOC116296189 [Actinia tenebrosa]
MVFLYKMCRFTIYYTAFFTTMCISDQVDNILWLPSVEGFVGDNVTLMWNSTNNRSIKSAVFGLSKQGMADPQFINVNTLTGKVHHNFNISKAYAWRVDFVGNLVAGRAWFIIKNLQLNDTNEYLARITIDVDTVRSYTVKLNVRQTNNSQRQKASTVPFITTKGWRPLNETERHFGTTYTPPVQNMAVDIKYILVSLSITLIIVFIFTGGCYCKKRNKSKQEKQHAKSINKDPTSKLLRAENNNIRDDKNNDNNDNNNEEILLVKKKEPDLAHIKAC